MKTIIYIDGYNLYYGCLKGTPHKWLDILKLFSEHIIPSSANLNTHSHIFEVKYFTANIVERAASSKESVTEQSAYHRGLKAYYNKNHFDIIKGYFSVTQTAARQVDCFNQKRAPKDCETVKIWKLEEKQTDVNIAIEAVYDVLTDHDLAHIVFVTNDTDLAPALAKIKSLNKVKVGLVIPTTKKERRPNAELVKYADWTRKTITEVELIASQLPRVVFGGRKPASKPESWFYQPALLNEILLTLMSVEESKNKCWQWLESTKPIVPNLPKLNDLPINLLKHKNSAKDVLIHAQAYVKFKNNKNR